MKQTETSLKLVMKHAILIAFVNNNSTSSFKEKVQVLKVHPRNVAMALHCRESMQMSKTFICPLSIWKKWKDMLAPRTKVIVLSWWAIETHMSPNQKEVVKKKLWSHLYENKLIQHLMETQIIFFFILGFLFLSFYCLLLHLTFFFSQNVSTFFPLYIGFACLRFLPFFKHWKPYGILFWNLFSHIGLISKL